MKKKPVRRPAKKPPRKAVRKASCSQVYEHDTGRELNSQLHIHAVAVNLTFEDAEARWKALQTGDICRHALTRPRFTERARD